MPTPSMTMTGTTEAAASEMADALGMTPFYSRRCDWTNGVQSCGHERWDHLKGSTQSCDIEGCPCPWFTLEVAEQVETE